MWSAICWPDDRVIGEEKGELPFLKTVVVELHYHHGADVETEILLRAVCEAAGVALDFSNPRISRCPIPEIVWNEAALAAYSDGEEEEE